MRPEKRQDFRVFETTTRTGETRWEIKTGGKNGDNVTTCRTLSEAQRQAQCLNLDPYYFDRMNLVKKTKTIVK